MLRKWKLDRIANFVDKKSDETRIKNDGKLNQSDDENNKSFSNKKSSMQGRIL
jgi:hypothetical protein